MALWCIKGGNHGQHESRMLEHNIIGIGWENMGDLNKFHSKDELKDRYRNINSTANAANVNNCAGQLWAFLNGMKTGDFVVVPLKTTSTIAVGKITSDYKCRNDLGEDMIHTHDVEWLATDLSRDRFDQDLLFSFGAFMTVCQVQREKAEERVLKITGGNASEPNGGDESEPIDIEQIARDQIVTRINQDFKGHDLAVLVEAILNAQGMTTKLSPPGPDGGVDILAGSGSMGFDAPRLCVQVKSSTSPADVTVARGLIGTMSAFGAELGLLVSWGGFTQAVIKESTGSFFKVRLWGRDDLLDAIFKYYDMLPEEIQNDIPLKRIWILAKNDDAS